MPPLAAALRRHLPHFPLATGSIDTDRGTFYDSIIGGRLY